MRFIVVFKIRFSKEEKDELLVKMGPSPFLQSTNLPIILGHILGQVCLRHKFEFNIEIEKNTLVKPFFLDNPAKVKIFGGIRPFKVI